MFQLYMDFVLLISKKITSDLYISPIKNLICKGKNLVMNEIQSTIQCIEEIKINDIHIKSHDQIVLDFIKHCYSKNVVFRNKYDFVNFLIVYSEQNKVYKITKMTEKKINEYYNIYSNNRTYTNLNEITTPVIRV